MSQHLHHRRLRIRACDSQYTPPNHRYIVIEPDAGRVQCYLASGIPAALSYAGILDDESAVRFQLEDVDSMPAALAILRKAGSRYFTYNEV